MVNALAPRLPDFRAGGPPLRADLCEAAWADMLAEVRPEERTVAANRCLWRVDMCDRREKRRRGGSLRGMFYYRATMNPQNRRTGDDEFAVLLASMRDGSLGRACVSLAEAFAKGQATYECEALLPTGQTVG